MAPTTDKKTKTEQSTNPHTIHMTDIAEQQAKLMHEFATHGLQHINMAQIGQESAKIMQQFMEKNGDGAMGMGSMQHVVKAFMSLNEKMMANPEKIVQMQMDWYQRQLSLWANVAERMMGKTPEPVATPEKGDRRFKHEDWTENMVFDFMKQSYLLTANWMLDNVRTVEGLDDRTREKVDFYVKQFIDAAAPTNSPFTNPEVLRKTMETGGKNLVNGLQNLLHDLERGKGKLRISMTDNNAFEIGKNIAMTEGAVVFRNRLVEVIQYTPKTPKVGARPLLIAPPWINKYYILDMRPENSFVRYCVEDCGLQTFIISWKNPDETYKDVGFDTYMKEGMLESIEHVLAITGQKDLNMIGYCIGGTLLSATLAYMAKKKDKRVNSATFFTTLMDFTEAGELGIFIDEEQVTDLEKRMNERGYLDGTEMASTFSMLRSNDLIWSFVVNNYLLGQDPFPFDLLYWNDDNTRMPAAMHSYYLRNMYLQNNLVKKDKLTLLGEKIDISQIDQPVYMVSAKSDHITPWKSCFAPMNKLKSNVRFILGNSGHVAGVANPASNPRGYFWAGDVNTDDAEKWLDGKAQVEGSWWPDWKEWIKAQSGAQVPTPKTLGDAKHKPLCPAPGTYVKE